MLQVLVIFRLLYNLKVTSCVNECLKASVKISPIYMAFHIVFGFFYHLARLVQLVRMVHLESEGSMLNPHCCALIKGLELNSLLGS